MNADDKEEHEVIDFFVSKLVNKEWDDKRTHTKH